MNYLKTILTVTIIVLGLWDGVSAVESNKRSNRIRRFANEGCDELIPAFLDQVLKNEHSTNTNDIDGSCDQSGTFPKPGDCTVFFKCIHPRGRIFIEYCAIGYTFVNDSCIRNKNATDCPQYNCELLDMNDQHESDEDTPVQSQTSMSVQQVVQSTSPPLLETSTELITDGDKKKESLNDEETKFAAQQAAPDKNDGGPNLTASSVTLLIMAVIARGVISGV